MPARRRVLLLLALVLGPAVAGGCSTEEYERQRDAARRARDAAPPKEVPTAREKASARRAASVAGGGGGVLGAGERGAAAPFAKSDEPFVRIAGWVVRGTDEASFRPCGSGRVSFIRGSQVAAPRLVQRYRFRAPAPLHPVYFEVKGRIRDDTIAVGSHVYTSVIEIAELVPEVPDAVPACPAPRRGSLIEAVQTVSDR